MRSVFALILVIICCTVEAKESSQKVQVYSLKPGKVGEPNTLICHVSNFHPPEISIQLLKNRVEMPGATQTDLAFEKGWQFHLTRSVAFTPLSDDEYVCQVTHMKKPLLFRWDPDM